MKLILSQPDEAGHVLLCRVEEKAGFYILFEGEDEARDFTDFLPDFILIGMRTSSESLPAAEDAVNVASVQLSPHPEKAQFTYMHIPTQEATDLTVEEALTFASRGVAFQITAGVHAEAADEATPDSVEPPK